MQSKTFKTLVEIIRQNGFSAAAKTLNATQSTVSKALSQLESHYGVALIERGKGKLRLTAAGECVYRHAQHILQEEEAIKREIAELKGLKRGQLRIGLPPIGSSELFAPVLADFTALHPDIDIEIVEHGSRKLEAMVLAGEIELAATLAPAVLGLDFQEVRNEAVVALCPDAVANRQKSAPLSKLALHPLILFESQFALTPIMMEVFKKAGFDVKITARSSQIDFILGLVAAGMGVGFLPRMIAQERHFPGVTIVEIEDAIIDWHMVLVWQQKATLSYAAKEWLRLSAKRHLEKR